VYFAGLLSAPRKNGSKGKRPRHSKVFFFELQEILPTAISMTAERKTRRKRQ
jgi:hypothetical protein